MPLGIAILTVSDTRDENTDRSGALLAQRLTEAGNCLYEKVIVKDDPQMISEQVSQWIADDKVEVIISTGGTGVTGRDGTPEAIEPLLKKKIDGFGELFRAISYKEISSRSKSYLSLP